MIGLGQHWLHCILTVEKTIISFTKEHLSRRLGNWLKQRPGQALSTRKIWNLQDLSVTYPDHLQGLRDWNLQKVNETFTEKKNEMKKNLELQPVPFTNSLPKLLRFTIRNCYRRHSGDPQPQSPNQSCWNHRDVQRTSAESSTLYLKSCGGNLSTQICCVFLFGWSVFFWGGSNSPQFFGWKSMIHCLIFFVGIFFGKKERLIHFPFPCSN